MKSPNKVIAAAAVLCVSLVFPRLTGVAAEESGGAEKSPVLVLKSEGRRYDLGPHLEIIEDKTGKLSIGDVIHAEKSGQFVKNRDAVPRFGFSGTAYWMRFRVKNDTGRDAAYLLELAYPHMNIFEIYTPGVSGTYEKRQAGDEFPFRDREVNYRNFLYRLAVAKNAEEVIYLRFAGNCSKEFPLVVWEPVTFAEMAMEEKFALGIYYGIIVVMMLYNLFLFFFVRDRSYLYYVIYIAMYGLVQVSYNGMAFQYLWPSFPAWHNISLPFLIGLTIFFMALFSKTFLHVKEYAPKLRFALPGIMGIGAFVVLFSLVGSYLVAIQLAMVLMVMASATMLATGFVCMIKGYRPARFYLIAWVAFLSGMVLIALNKLNVLPGNFITEYAIQIGSALEVTLLSLALADRINIINQEKRAAQREAMDALQEKTRQKDLFLAEITEANRKISLSEEKYRFLVEGSNDLIFSLDEHFHFITVNNAIYNKFSILPEELPSVGLLDLIYEGLDKDSVTRQVVQEQLDNFARNRKPVSFRAEFKSSIKSEPKEMQVWLEYINIEGKNEILGKATSVHDDILIKYFDCEKQRFTIENYLLTADEMTHRMTRNLKKFMEHKEINVLRTALREVIINSIEHGNLNITFEEKSEALVNDRYFDFIAERQSDPRYRGRKVEILYSIDSEKVVFRVTDEGSGFDYQKYLENDCRDANEAMLAHGRGISLMKNVFDEVTFNRKGNQVMLMKRLDRLHS